jgi:hypothetical protein
VRIGLTPCGGITELTGIAAVVEALRMLSFGQRFIRTASGHRRAMMGRTWRLLMAVAVVGLVLAAPVVSASAHTDQVQVQAAPSPSPTLGSTESPAPNPPGSTNASPRDYNGAWLVVVAVLVVAVIVGAGTFYMSRRTRGFDLSQTSEPEDEKTHSHSRSDRNN